MIDVHEAYALFNSNAKDCESFVSVAEHDDCYCFFTEDNSLGAYYVLKDTGEI